MNDTGKKHKKTISSGQFYWHFEIAQWHSDLIGILWGNWFCNNSFLFVFSQ